MVDLRDASPDTGALAKLAGLLRNPDPRIRLRAVEALNGHESPLAVALLLRSLQDPDDGVKACAIGSLDRLGPPTVLRHGCAILGEQKEWLRDSACYGLGLLRDPGLAEHLIGRLNDPSLTVRRKARAGLRLLDPEKVPEVRVALNRVSGRESQQCQAILERLATESDMNAFVQLIRALGHFESEEIVSVLRGYSDHPVESVREAARVALILHGAPEHSTPEPSEPGWTSTARIRTRTSGRMVHGRLTGNGPGRLAGNGPGRLAGNGPGRLTGNGPGRLGGEAAGGAVGVARRSAGLWLLAAPFLVLGLLTIRGLLVTQDHPTARESRMSPGPRRGTALDELTRTRDFDRFLGALVVWKGTITDVNAFRDQLLIRTDEGFFAVVSEQPFPAFVTSSARVEVTGSVAQRREGVVIIRARKIVDVTAPDQIVKL